MDMDMDMGCIIARAIFPTATRGAQVSASCFIESGYEVPRSVMCVQTSSITRPPPHRRTWEWEVWDLSQANETNVEDSSSHSQPARTSQKALNQQKSFPLPLSHTQTCHILHSDQKSSPSPTSSPCSLPHLRGPLWSLSYTRASCWQMASESTSHSSGEQPSELRTVSALRSGW